MSDTLVVVPCGGAKRTHPCPAGEMYVGGYHKACRKYASKLAGGDEDSVVILSAKYGLLRLAEVIRPYELRMGRPGSVTVQVVESQAVALGLADRSVVIALGGRGYTKVCLAVWPHCLTPLGDKGGIGKQLRWMKGQLCSA